MRMLWRAAVIVAGCAMALGRGVRAQQGEAVELVSVRDGVYTEAQAVAGGTVFATVCEACHMTDEFTGSFMLSWSGATLNVLYDLIRTRMPEDRPGALRPREYAAVVAYVLALNGLPVGGEPLAADSDALRRIRIERQP